MSGLDDLFEDVRAQMSQQRDLASVPFLGDVQEEAGVLLACYQQLTTAQDFTLGDLVVFKPGLRPDDLKFPASGQPVIATGTQMDAVNPEESAGSNSYRRPNDLRVGVLVNGSFDEYWVDARRFIKYVAAEPAPVTLDLEAPL